MDDNRDTHLVKLWLDNHRGNYDFLKRHKSKLMKMSKTQLFLTLQQNLFFGDTIKWRNVNASAIKETISDVE